MPNRASSYQGGDWYWTNEAQSGRNGPAQALLSSRASHCWRSGSNRLSDFSHCSEICSGVSCLAVASVALAAPATGEMQATAMAAATIAARKRLILCRAWLGASVLLTDVRRHRQTSFVREAVLC
jgi:hypothetical protein